MDEKRAVGLSLQLHTHVRPHTFKNLGCKPSRMQSCFLIFSDAPLSSSASQVVEHLQRLLRGQPRAHQKTPLHHRHFQGAAGSHLVQLVAVMDPGGVSALYHRACGCQSSAL